MACLIERNNEGKINRVTTPSGERSQLFDAIHSNIFLADAGTSVKILQNAYTDKMQKTYDGAESNVYETGEPKLFYQSNSNKEYDNLEELLINEDNGNVTMGFKHPKTDEFTPVAKFTTRDSVRNEFLASKVREGVISAERVLGEDGVTRFQGKGSFTTAKVATGQMFASDLIEQTGNGRVKVNNDGTIEAEFATEYSEAINENGDVEVIKTENIPDYLKESDPVNKGDLALEFTLKHDNPRPIDKEKRTTKRNNSSVKDLERSLFQFLKSLGFTTTTLDKYRANYKTKFGTDPDIQAMADLANMIVAFKEGKVGIEDLSEEVAHIAIEAYSDQNSIASALANVHLSPEYTEFAEYYREKYAPHYEGVALEDQVRREVLGKILKKEFIRRFETQGRTENEIYLVSRLREIWESFVNGISNIIKPYHRKSLDKLNKRIADSVINNTSADFLTDLSDNTNFYYNAMDTEGKTINAELQIAKRTIEDLYKVALGQPVPNQEELDRLAKVSGNLDMLSSINTIVNIAQRQMDVLATNVNEAAKKGELISAKDASRYEVLKNNLIPNVNSIKTKLSKEDFPESVHHRIDNLEKSADEIVVQMSRVEPLINKDKESWVKSMMQRVLSKVSLNEEQKQEVMDSLEGGMKDIGWLGKMFGLASHSKNPVIQLLQYQVIKINTMTRKRFNSRANEIIDKIEAKGLRKYQKSIIHKGKDGKNTHYLLSPRDYALYDKLRLDEENRLLAEYTGQSIEKVEELRRKFNPSELIKDETKHTEFLERMGEWKDRNEERRFTQEYYEERDKRFEKANVSDATQLYLRTKNSGRYARRKKYVQPDGTIDLSQQTEAEKIEDRNDFKQHLAIKSAYDSAGNLKPGLRRVKASELSAEEKAALPYTVDADFVGDLTLLAPGETLENLSEESRRALDLFNLDMLYREELQSQAKTNKPIQKFLDIVSEKEGAGEVAYEWVMSNASIGLSSNFYDNLGTSVSFNDVAQEFIDDIEDPTDRRHKQAILDNLISKQRTRKELLKQNKQAGSAIDTDVHHMTTQVRKTLLDLDEEITDLRRSLNLPFELFEETGGLEGSESRLNEDFEKMLVDSGDTVFDFAINHMSKRNMVMSQDFAMEVSDYLKGRRTHVKPHFDRFISQTISTEEYKQWLRSRKQELKKEGVSDAEFQKQIKDEMLQKLKDEYAKSKVASYFRRFQPEGYSELISAMRNGELSMSDVINKSPEAISKFPALEFVDITPEYSWTEDINNSEFLNPNFKTEGPVNQPKQLNDEFFKRYGINKDDYLALESEDLRLLKPTRNAEEYELLTLMTEMRDESADNYGDKGFVNKYLRVQKSKEKMEQVLNIHKGTGATIRDFVSDLGRSRLDEKDYGEEVEGTGINVKVVPKYYQTKEEDPRILTENTIEAAMLDLKASIRYSERKNAERDVKALEYKISQQKFKNGGGNSLRSRILKRGEVSNYYTKAQEMVDNHLYGIRQSRRMVTNIFGMEVDFTQLFGRVTNYARTVNLAFNFIADATSYTTGVYNNLIDAAAGDYYHKSSLKRSTAKLPGMVMKYMAESGKVKKTSELNHLLEFYGIEESEEKFRESASNRFVRLSSKSFFGASKVANMPVTPKNMLNIVFDHKFHNGRFKSFNDFARDMRIENKDMDKKAIESLWEGIDETFYENITIDPNKGVIANQKFKDKFGEKWQEEFDELHVRMTNKISQVNQSVDSIVSESDQTAAQRDALTNALLLHRGWFMINLTRKFKGKHFNIATGQIEEGHYRSVLKTLYGWGKSRMSKDAREEWDKQASEYESRNLKRLGADTLGAMMLIGLTNMLLRGDDEDDTVFENFAQLIALRTTSEVQSIELLGIAGSSADIYDQPIVQLGLFNNTWKAIKKGEMSYFKKNILVYRRKNQLSDLQKQIDSYMYFNNETLLGVNPKEDMDTDDLSKSSAIRVLD